MAHEAVARNQVIGTSLNQYRITASIGAGGMGEVFRAQDARLNRGTISSRRINGGGRLRDCP
jgi:hypothetical protein